MTTDRKPVDRRNVLKATGAALGAAVVGAGAAAASGRDAHALEDPTPVFDNCDGVLIGSVPEGSQGPVYDDCTDTDGDVWYYVSWDSASPDGWVHEDTVYLL